MKNVAFVDVYDFNENIFDQIMFDIPKHLCIMDEMFDNFTELTRIFTDYTKYVIKETLLEFHLQFTEGIIKNIYVSFIDDNYNMIWTTEAYNIETNEDSDFEFDIRSVYWKAAGVEIKLCIDD